MTGSLCRRVFPLLLCFLAVSYSPARAGETWLPIVPEELNMTSEPKAPGAPAIYLYRQVDLDDLEHKETIYIRIKIFNEEGRKYADIEIPYVKRSGDIKNLQARTIHPDGAIINFDGKMFDSTIVKAKGFKYQAKTFTMPDVQPGSIVEYHYTRINTGGWFYDSQWLLSEELFTKHAKFSLRPYGGLALQWSWPRGLPLGTSPPVDDNHVIRLETQNVPAFQIEDYMPPQEEEKFRVDFTYAFTIEADSDKFWKERDKLIYTYINSFVDKRKGMEEAVTQIISPTDTPEQKLQKIYARCQKIHNTSYERDKTQQERNRERLKDIHNVEDVWKRGYGESTAITWLFLALSRAAGFDASPVLISTRDKHFFNRKLKNPYLLNATVVLVNLNGKDLYLNPGNPFAPFGLLPWYEMAVAGLRIGKDDGTWITTTTPEPSDAGMERKATLQLNDSGELEGNVTVTYKGLSALWRRIDKQDADDAERKKFLEDELKSYIPVPSEAELTNTPDWNTPSPTLVAEYNLKIPNWTSSAGRRTLFAAGLFGGSEKHVFDGTNRVHPIYFSYPYSDVDDIIIALPSGSTIANLPDPQRDNQKVCDYSSSAEKSSGSLHLSRTLMVNVGLLDPKYYPALRKFFQTVRNGDDQQIILAADTH